MPASPKHWLSHRSLRHSLRDSFTSTKIPASLQLWVPHLRDGFIVVKVGIVRSTTAPAHLTQAKKAEVAH
jgi:hypothetical protein